MMIKYEKLIQPTTQFGIPTFKHEDIGIKGINGKPFVAMDEHIGLTNEQWEEIDFEIIIVDDGSTDGSLEKALFLQNQFSSLKVFSHHLNQGKGAAVQTGIKQASIQRLHN